MALTKTSSMELARLPSLSKFCIFCWVFCATHSLICNLICSVFDSKSTLSTVTWKYLLRMLSNVSLILHSLWIHSLLARSNWTSAIFIKLDQTYSTKKQLISKTYFTSHFTNTNHVQHIILQEFLIWELKTKVISKSLLWPVEAKNKWYTAVTFFPLIHVPQN